jgi:signal peptidase I
MHLSIFLIALLIGLGLAIVVFSLWLSLKIFGLKSDGGNLRKLVGIEAVFLVLTSLAGSKSGGGLGPLFNLLFLVGGVVLWAVLLKRFAASKYSLGRAIGSYATSCVFALLLSLAGAILGIAFFAQVYKIDGDSMAPALKADQTVLVYKFEKHPDNNAMVVYRNSKGSQVLGRVHGTPGQAVAIQSGSVEVNGNLQVANSFTLESNQYYVTADNAAYNIPPRIIDGSNIVGTIGPKL